MTRDSSTGTLASTIRSLAPVADHPALLHLVDALRERHGEQVTAVLFYGSCLRSGDPYDGLADLYLVVDNYRSIGQGSLKAMWNWLLPPNVFYAEYPFGQHRIRSKYAILSVSDLQRGTSKRWFHSYLWGRFSQPTALAWCRDETSRRIIENSLAQAVITLLDRALPSLAESGDIVSLWTDALQLSYRTELRPESSSRAAELVESNREYYQQVTEQAAPLLRYPLRLDKNSNYHCPVTAHRRLFNRAGWKIRLVQGKLLSVARLSKALFTFDGGLDYIAWKLERHSGTKIDIPERVRKYPLIFVWGMFWNLYRRGVFR